MIKAKSSTNRSKMLAFEMKMNESHKEQWNYSFAPEFKKQPLSEDLFYFLNKKVEDIELFFSKN